jgi:hypothetical protein
MTLQPRADPPVMATATLTKHAIPGVLGDILIDLRAAGRASPRPAVVVVHGFKGFKDWGMFPPFSERLARAGFTAVTPNLSGSGVDDQGDFVYPERFGHNTFSAELEDLRRVIEVLIRGELGVPSPPSLKAGQVSSISRRPPAALPRPGSWPMGLRMSQSRSRRRVHFRPVLVPRRDSSPSRAQVTPTARYIPGEE